MTKLKVARRESMKIMTRWTTFHVSRWTGFSHP